ncbi:MAG TPA: hypothetical protein VKA21_02330 [Candidatus Binatia bacterium]|nr:hypothetical protein [Candidatus Binatia bacterium]
MTPFKTVAVVATPVEPLYAFMRDRLAELVPDLSDVRSIRVVERRKSRDGSVRLVNEWRAATRLPSAVAGIVGADDLGWLDRAVYGKSDRVCRWEIEPFLFREHVQCEGTTTYESAMAGRGSRVTFAGRFELDSSALQRHVGLLHQPVTRLVESIVTTLIPRNFRRMIDAAARRCR